MQATRSCIAEEPDGGCHVFMSKPSGDSDREHVEFLIETDTPAADLEVTVWRNGIHVHAAARRGAAAAASAGLPRAAAGPGELCESDGEAGRHSAVEWKLLSPAPLLSNDAELAAFPGGLKVKVGMDVEAAARTAEQLQMACALAGLGQ